MSENISEDDRTWETLNSGKRTRGSGRGGKWGDRVTFYERQRKIREGDKPWETPNCGKRTRGSGRGGGWGDGVTGWRALRRALDGMSTGCYTICWQIELQLKVLFFYWVMGTKEGTWWDEHWVLYYMLANWTEIKHFFFVFKLFSWSSICQNMACHPVLIPSSALLSVPITQSPQLPAHLPFHYPLFASQS